MLSTYGYQKLSLEKYTIFRNFFYKDCTNYNMSYELFISLRYLEAKRKQAFISLISIISIGGVAVGVAALIIVLAVMTGFKNDVRDKILGTMAHIIIQKTGMI